MRRADPRQMDLFAEILREKEEAWAAERAAQAKPPVPVKPGVQPKPSVPEKIPDDWPSRPEWWERAAREHWRYARDLMTEEHWRDLMATRERTSWEHIANAVQSGVSGGRLSLTSARAVMAEMDWPEPADRSDALLRGLGFMTGGCKWKPGYRAFCSAFIHVGAWLVIHAIEDGWVEQHEELLWVTQKWVDAHPHPVRPDKKAIVAKAKATKSKDTESVQGEFAGTDIAEAIRRSLPKDVPLPYRKPLKISIEQRPNDMRQGRKGPALVGRFVMFDGQEATCVITGTFRTDEVTMSNRTLTVKRLEFRDFIQHSWLDVEVPFGWDQDLRQWRRYPRRPRSSPS